MVFYTYGSHSVSNKDASIVIGHGPNTVLESTVSNTEISEFCGPHQVPRRELSEFLSAYHLCANANSPSFSQNSPSSPQNSVSSLFRNSTLETVFCPFPMHYGAQMITHTFSLYGNYLSNYTKHLLHRASWQEILLCNLGTSTRHFV